MPFAEARALVLEAFRRFSPELAEIAREFFEKRWIDVYPRPGKRGGAFCSGGLPSTHPYILLNHTDDLDSAHTLAHELGHGVHFYLARKQRLLNFGASTPSPRPPASLPRSSWTTSSWRGFPGRKRPSSSRRGWRTP